MLTTPWIPGKLKEFWNFFPRPWKLLEEQVTSLYFWKTPLSFVRDRLSVLWTNRNLQKTLTHVWTFCNLCWFNVSCCYIGKNYLILFCFCWKRIEVSSWKNKFFALKDSWKTHEILLLSVNEHHANPLTSWKTTLVLAKNVGITFFKTCMVLNIPGNLNFFQGG